MAGRIEAIDIAERAFEIVTGVPREPVAAIQAELTRLAEAEAPALPGSTAQIERDLVPTTPLNSGAPTPLEAAFDRPTPLEVAQAFGIGREFDSTDKAGVIFPRITLPDFAAEAERVAREAASRIAALPTTGVTLETVVPRPGTEAIRETPATFEIPIPEVNPIPDAGEMRRLSALAGIALNDPRAIAAYAPSTPPPAPLAVDAATGAVPVRGGTIGNVRGRLVVHTGAVGTPAAALAAGEEEKSFGVGVGIDLAA